MKKIIKAVKAKSWEFLGQTLVMLGAVLGAAPAVFASFSWSTPSVLEQVMQLMGSGFTFIGVAIIIFGAVQIAFAFRSDDAEGKAKGLRSAVSGAIVAIVGGAMTAFYGG